MGRVAIGVDDVRVDAMLEVLVQEERRGDVREGDVCGGDELQVLPAEGVEDGVPGVGCDHLPWGWRGAAKLEGARAVGSSWF